MPLSLPLTVFDLFTYLIERNWKLCTKKQNYNLPGLHLKLYGVLIIFSVCVCTCKLVHLSLCVYVCVCMCMCMYVCLSVSVWVCACVWVHVCVLLCVCVCLSLCVSRRPVLAGSVPCSLEKLGRLLLVMLSYRVAHASFWIQVLQSLSPTCCSWLSTLCWAQESRIWQWGLCQLGPKAAYLHLCDVSPMCVLLLTFWSPVQ